MLGIIMTKTVHCCHLEGELKTFDKKTHRNIKTYSFSEDREALNRRRP